MMAAKAKMARECLHCKPARKAPTAASGTSTRAVPRSGCFMIRATGIPISTAALAKSARLSCSVRTSEKKRAKNGKPTLGSEAGIPNDQNRDQRDYCDQVQNGGLIHDRVVIHTRERKHQDETQADPLQLMGVHPREGARVRRRPNFQHTDAADSERRRQQPPIIIAYTRWFLHEYLPAGRIRRQGRIVDGGRHDFRRPILRCVLLYFYSAL